MTAKASRFLSCVLGIAVTAPALAIEPMNPIEIAVRATDPYSTCNLVLKMESDETGRAELLCEVTDLGKTYEHRAGRADRALGADEIAHLKQSLQTAEIHEAPFWGTDERFADVSLRTMEVRDGLGYGVLVTSGNPSFEKGPRRELTDFIHGIEVSLENQLR